MTAPAVPPGGEELRCCGAGNPETCLPPCSRHPALFDGADELREAVGHAIFTAGVGHMAKADAILALPAVRDALAAQEAVKRVEVLAEEFDKRAMYGGALVWTRIRRALDGAP